MSNPSAVAPALPEYSPHPLSEIFPPMGAEGLAALTEDIKTNRLKEPIWLFEGRILDGNNRYRACLKISYPFKDDDFRQFDPKVLGDPLAFVVSANLHRRHLNESQRAGIAARLVTSKLGYNQYNRAGITNEKAAKLLGVSEATVKMAKAVAEKAAPEVLEKVQKGELRLNAATQLPASPRTNKPPNLRGSKLRRRRRRKLRKLPEPGPPAAEEPAANQKMKALEEFKSKWIVLDEMQRRAFVISFYTELAELVAYQQEQQAMIGGATANVG